MSTGPSLVNSRIDHRYISLLTNIYNKATTRINLYDGTNAIKINRGIRQGDSISPKLFNQALEDIFKQLDWNGYGININGQRLHHLRYADDIVLFSHTKEELQTMLEDLGKQASRVGLRMNYSKTKTMTNTEESATINFGTNTIEQTEEYIYLGQLVKLNKENQTVELKRRIRLAWVAFGKLSFILRNKKYPQYLKTRVYDQCVLPVLTYGSQVWTFTKANMDKIAKTQRSMERQMLGIKLSDRKRIEWIRERTKVRDARVEVAGLKWRYAGHNVRVRDERWNKVIITWRPWQNKRSRGRPQMRWHDDIKSHAGRQWLQEATDRNRWKLLGEAYVQKWAN